MRPCLLHEAATHGVQIVRPQAGYRWTDDGVAIDVLAPSLPVLAGTGDDINENSIVAMLNYDGFRELFMGDAGESSESRLIATLERIGATIYRTDRCGSATLGQTHVISTTVQCYPLDAARR